MSDIKLSLKVPMKTNLGATFINTEQLIAISGGDKKSTINYLRQFQELIPDRIEKLKENLNNKDRKGTRQILHQMSPQIQFFGIPDVVVHIKKLEFEYKAIPIEDLKSLVENIILKLKLALEDIDLILKRIG